MCQKLQSHFHNHSIRTNFFLLFPTYCNYTSWWEKTKWFLINLCACFYFKTKYSDRSSSMLTIRLSCADPAAVWGGAWLDEGVVLLNAVFWSSWDCNVYKSRKWTKRKVNKSTPNRWVNKWIKKCNYFLKKQKWSSALSILKCTPL